MHGCNYRKSNVIFVFLSKKCCFCKRRENFARLPFVDATFLCHMTYCFDFLSTFRTQSYQQKACWNIVVLNIYMRQRKVITEELFKERLRIETSSRDERWGASFSQHLKILLLSDRAYLEQKGEHMKLSGSSGLRYRFVDINQRKKIEVTASVSSSFITYFLIKCKDR